ncbi:MAG: tetratricopeptide repeat protein [Sedimentisphaerales bacterium]|nr:tetratricopeptide repeat protein [Sedimentisphaerales bacterium]
MKAKKLKTIAIITMSLTLSQLTFAGSVEDLVQQGNNLYNKGNLNDALKEYDEALIDQPQALEPKFNKANCYFQLDDLAQAIDLYNEVAAESKDMKLVEKAKYNLGNCYFQQGSKQTDSNLQKAMEDMQTSIVCWRGALEINPENEKAAKNIEVARLTIKDIIDQINKQKQEQQQQAQKQKQLQQQLKELAEKQKVLAQKTQQTNDQAQEEQISQQQAEDNYKQQAQDQSQLQAQTEQTLQKMLQQDPNQPLPQQAQQAGKELKKAINKQKDAEKQLEVSEGNEAKQSQDRAAEHIENALKELSQGNQNREQQQQKQQEQQGQSQQSQDPNEAQQQKSQDQQTAAMTDATAQEILDKEKREKRQRQMLRQSGYQRVEKDW